MGDEKNSYDSGGMKNSYEKGHGPMKESYDDKADGGHHEGKGRFYPSATTAPHFGGAGAKADTFRSAHHTKDGALRNSGSAGAHRIGGKNPGGHCLGKKK
jgi:hypothetical protein